MGTWAGLRVLPARGSAPRLRQGRRQRRRARGACASPPAVATAWLGAGTRSAGSRPVGARRRTAARRQQHRGVDRRRHRVAAHRRGDSQGALARPRCRLVPLSALRADPRGGANGSALAARDDGGARRGSRARLGRVAVAPVPTGPRRRGWCSPRAGVRHSDSSGEGSEGAAHALPSREARDRGRRGRVRRRNRSDQLPRRQARQPRPSAAGPGSDSRSISRRGWGASA